MTPATEQELDENPARLERWVYLGQYDTKDHRWRDPAGKVRSYKVSARVPGGLYEIEVERTEGKVSIFAATLRYVGVAPDDDRAQIQAAAMKRELIRTSASLERRTSRVSEIDDAIAPLIALASKLIGFSNREALAKYVTYKIYSA